jgi:hypothetical protein
MFCLLVTVSWYSYLNELTHDNNYNYLARSYLWYRYLSVLVTASRGSQLYPMYSCAKLNAAMSLRFFLSNMSLLKILADWFRQAECLDPDGFGDGQSNPVSNSTKPRCV